MATVGSDREKIADTEIAVIGFILKLQAGTPP
jgi:hypothetical protein